MKPVKPFIAAMLLLLTTCVFAQDETDLDVKLFKVQGGKLIVCIRNPKQNDYPYDAMCAPVVPDFKKCVESEKRIECGPQRSARVQ